MMNMLTLRFTRASALRSVIVSAIVAVLLLPANAYAASTPLGRAQTLAQKSGLKTGPEASLTSLLGRIISTVIGLVGVVFLVLTIYAGFLWMTAGGNEEKIAKAKRLLSSSIIGLVIVLAAYTIATFVVSAVTEGTTPGGGEEAAP